MAPVRHMVDIMSKLVLTLFQYLFYMFYYYSFMSVIFIKHLREFHWLKPFFQSYSARTHAHTHKQAYDIWKMPGSFRKLSNKLTDARPDAELYQSGYWLIFYQSNCHQSRCVMYFKKKIYCPDTHCCHFSSRRHR